MTDINNRCAAKEQQWEQRKQGRKDEIHAITSAVHALEEKHDSFGKRGFLQQQKEKSAKQEKTDVQEIDIGDFATSFIQTKIARHLNEPDAVAAAKLLRESGKKYNSEILLQTADKLTGPFEKVKRMIQALIERLLEESAKEAKNSGNCETELRNQESQRDSRAAEVKELDGKMQSLESTKLSLESNIETLETDIKQLNADLEEDIHKRDENNEENIASIQTSKEGLEAVNLAIKFLKEYYHGKFGVGGADTATVLVQKTSPLDEQLEGDYDVAGIEGAYQGNQGAASNIFGLLEVIRTDTQRARDNTQKLEDEQKADSIQFQRKLNASLKSKETELFNKNADRDVAIGQLRQSEDDMKTQMEMLADAVEQIMKLWPLCVSVDMSWDERKNKMESEIQALQKALEILKPNEGER